MKQLSRAIVSKVRDSVTRQGTTLATMVEKVLPARSLRREAEMAVPTAGPRLSSTSPLEEGFRQMTYTFAVIALSAKLALADGDINERERMAFHALFPLPQQERSKTERLFAMAQDDPNPYTHYVRQIASLFPQRRLLAEELVRKLCALAEADGRATLAEIRMLEHIATVLEVGSGVVNASLLTRFDAQARTSPYALLNVSASCSNDELKQAYRTRMRELHPDTLMAAGYAAEDVEQAGAELRAVQDAYKTLSRKRKIK